MWRWIADQPDGDDPRGDFTRDTRYELSEGRDPADALQTACHEAQEEYNRLEHGEPCTSFSWDKLCSTMKHLGLIDASHQAQLEGALENWREEGINVRWMVERDARSKSIHYVITVDPNRLHPRRRPELATRED